MTYRKFNADYLFTGTVLLDDNYVLITGDQGKIVDIVDKSAAGGDVEKCKGLLSPGFVNTHCHLELSHLKNLIPEHTGLVDFVCKVVDERHFKDEEIIDSVEKAEDEMLKNGIVAVGDICNNALSLPCKKVSSMKYYNFIEVSGWNPEIANTRFEKSKAYFDEFIKNGQKSSLVPHAPYSVSENLWGKIAPFFPGKVITIHSQESEGEDEFFLKGGGNLIEMYKKMNIDNSFYRPPKIRSPQHYLKHLSKAASAILVHNTFTKQEDLDYINKNKAEEQLISFCLCANANLYIENVLPPVEMFFQNNCNIVIGTDSLASNNELSIIEELKTIAKNFPSIPMETLLQWSTLNGAKALKMDDKLGSFEKGKQPGIVLIKNLTGKAITENTVAGRIL